MNKKPGRPRKESEPQKNRTLTLSGRHIEKAKLIGDGNASDGVRVALDNYINEEWWCGTPVRQLTSKEMHCAVKFRSVDDLSDFLCKNYPEYVLNNKITVVDGIRFIMDKEVKL